MRMTPYLVMVFTPMKVQRQLKNRQIEGLDIHETHRTVEKRSKGPFRSQISEVFYALGGSKGTHSSGVIVLQIRYNSIGAFPQPSRTDMLILDWFIKIDDSMIGYPRVALEHLIKGILSKG